MRAASVMLRRQPPGGRRAASWGTQRLFSSEAVPEMTSFPGAMSPYTTNMEFVETTAPMHCFRRTDLYGQYIDSAYKPQASDEKLIQMYTTMRTLSTMDQVFYDSQRQGRISFYMTSGGEEAIHIGTAAALDPEDVIYAQYREAGTLLWRGFGLEQITNQLFSNKFDLGKGRQMPIHYGSRELNFHTISSPLGTQIPHAVGAAYAFKQEGKGRIAACYFGDGAASEGDAHSAFNMAATLEAPVLFICRNNGYAISTPTNEQYRGDGIAARGPALGIKTLRVDGMDMLAVYDATVEGRRICSETSRPVLIEAMSYRCGHHSTSDDSTAYRERQEIEFWTEERSALTRTRMLLEKIGLWDGDKEIELVQRLRKEVLASMKNAESHRRPPLSQMFEDIYKEKTPLLKEQYQEMLEHLEVYGDEYNLGEFLEDHEYENPAKDR